MLGKSGITAIRVPSRLLSKFKVMKTKLGSRYQLSITQDEMLKYPILPVWQKTPTAPATHDKVLCELDLNEKPIVVLIEEMDYNPFTPREKPEFWCKLLTSNGIVGWAYLGSAKLTEI